MPYIEEKVEQLERDITTLKEQLGNLLGVKSQPEYTVKQVAEILEISRAGVNYHIRIGNLQSTGGKRNKKVTEAALKDFMSKQSTAIKENV